jgi:hypothetical protein
MMIYLDMLAVRLAALNKRERGFAFVILILIICFAFDFAILDPYLKSSKSQAQAKDLATLELNNLRKKRSDLMAELSALENSLSSKAQDAGRVATYSESDLSLWVKKMVVDHSQCVSKWGIGHLTPLGGGVNKHELFFSGFCAWPDLARLLRDVRTTRGLLSSLKIDGDSESLLSFSVSYLVVSKKETLPISSGEAR